MALVVCAFVVYLSNLRFIYTGDTVPTRLLPFSVLLDQNLYLDRYVEPYLQPYRDGTLPYKPYFVARSRGHWMSSYPILTPLLVAPLYAPAAFWLSRHRLVSSEAVNLLAEGMEKLCAAILVALSVGVLFTALRKLLSPRASLLLSLIYGFASHTWCTSSQVLYLHALTELSFTFLLWALLHFSLEGGSAFWVGLALAVAVSNKLTNALVAFPLIVYFLLRHRDKLLAFFAPLFGLGVLVLSYNMHFFGTPAGAYSDAFHSLGYASIGAGFRGSFWLGLAGLLVSPNRGLLVFIPWTALAIWGAVRLWRERRFGWEPCLLISCVAVVILYSRLERWYGGYTFGPRYLIDLLPFLAFFLVPLYPTISRRPVVKFAFALAVAASLWVQVVGVYYYPHGDWDTAPVSVDADPHRVWDWKDSELYRTWGAGPAHSHLVEHLRDVKRSGKK